MQAQSTAKLRRSAQPVRIYDVAARAGVSLATVSAVLTGNRPVAAATRKFVQAAIDDLGYRANASARSLAGGRTQTIALLIPPIAPNMSVIQMEFIANVVEAARAHNYDVLVSVADHQDDAFLRLATERRVDGFLLLEVFLRDRRVESLKTAGIPFVIMGRTEQDDVSSWVDIDFHWTMEQFVRLLSEHGCRRLALFNSSDELYDAGYGPAVRSEQGFVLACDELGLDAVVLHCGRAPDTGYAETAELTDRRDTTTAFIVTNEHVLPGIYRALAERGLRIPVDVVVVALTDRLSAAALDSVPVTVEHPVLEMANAAVELLVEELASPGTAKQGRLLRPRLTGGGLDALDPIMNPGERRQREFRASPQLHMSLPRPQST